MNLRHYPSGIVATRIQTVTSSRQNSPASELRSNIEKHMSTGIIIYALFWLAFAAVHSWLARIPVQQALERHFGKTYRLVYNLVALVQILIVYMSGRAALATANFPLLDQAVVSAFCLFVQLLGLLIIVYALRFYDLGRFAGITQLFTGERLTKAQAEPLHRNGLNQWMRHPLYTGAFLVLWGGATSIFGFWTAVWGTLYLIIGTLFEERKLIRVYGDEYTRYQQQVPRYFPRSGSGSNSA